MLHMVIMRHTAESCPGRAGNEEVIACVNKLHELTAEREIRTVGSWADPPAHINYLVMDAPSAHALQQLIMDSGVVAYSMTEIHPVFDITPSD